MASLSLLRSAHVKPCLAGTRPQVPPASGRDQPTRATFPSVAESSPHFYDAREELEHKCHKGAVNTLPAVLGSPCRGLVHSRQHSHPDSISALQALSRTLAASFRLSRRTSPDINGLFFTVQEHSFSCWLCKAFGIVIPPQPPLQAASLLPAVITVTRSSCFVKQDIFSVNGARIRYFVQSIRFIAHEASKKPAHLHVITDSVRLLRDV